MRDPAQALEPFSHPSNAGPWSGAIAKFLGLLLELALERIRDGTDARIPCKLNLGPQC